VRGIAAVSSCLPKSAGPLSSSVRANALPRRGRSDPRRQRRRTGIACSRGAHCCFPNLVARINPRGQGGDGTIDVWAPQRDGVACPPSVTPIYLKNCSTTVEIPIGCWQGRRCYEAPLCTAVAPVMMALILSASGAPSTTRAQKRATPSTKQPRMSRATRRVMCGFAAGDAGPARSLSAGIGQCREKCRPVLCPRQTFSRGNSRSRTETGSNVGRDQFESQCLGLAPLPGASSAGLSAKSNSILFDSAPRNFIGKPPRKLCWGGFVGNSVAVQKYTLELG
jgi:hypothetical protein